MRSGGGGLGGVVQGRGRGEIGHFKERILKKIVSREGGKGKGLTKKRERERERGNHRE